MQRKHLIIILFAILLAYSPIFQNDFVFDDTKLLLWHQSITLQDIPAFFTQGITAPGHSGTYGPLASTFWQIALLLFGSNPFGYHLQTIIILFLASILVYKIAHHLTKKSSCALWAGILFALHPIHIEAVTYITTSFDIWAIVFSLSAFLLYIKKKNKFLVGIFSTLAFFTHELSLSLPLLFLLYDWTIKNQKPYQLLSNWKAYLPTIIPIALYLSIRFFVLDITTRGSYLAASGYHTFLTMTKAFLKYLLLLLLPYKLTINHTISPGIHGLYFADKNPQAILSQTIIDPQIILSIVILLGLFSLIFLCRNNKPLISFVIGWFFITLLPVSFILPQAAIFIEKYAFFASVSSCIALPYIFQDLPKQKKFQKLGVILLILLSSFYLVQTLDRNAEWKDEHTLWSQAIEHAPNSKLVNLNYGVALFNKGHVTKAQMHFQKAIEIDPSYAKAYLNMGATYLQLGQTSTAIPYFQKALTINPNYQKAQENLAYALSLEEKKDGQ